VEFRGIQRRTAKNRGLLGIFAAILLNCSASGAPGGQSVEPEAKPTSQQQPEQQPEQQTVQDQIDNLLENATTAQLVGQLIYPARGSAMSLYHEVLFIDPGNPAAQRGLEQVVDHFLGDAAAAIAAERYSKARGALSRARMVDPNNTNIEPIAAELRLLEKAERSRTVLDWQLVAARSSELTPILRRAGVKARKDGCHAVISVSNDAEGRWIYQQLSRAPGERRIQAQIRIASPSAVEVLCFRES
jgi:hypothetical protein